MAILIKKLKKLSLSDLIQTSMYVDHLLNISKVEGNTEHDRLKEFESVANQEIKERIYDLFEETAKTDF